MRFPSRAFVYSGVLGLAGLLGVGSTPAKAQGFGYGPPMVPVGGFNVQVGGPQFAIGFQSGYVAPLPVYQPTVGFAYGVGVGPGYGGYRHPHHHGHGCGCGSCGGSFGGGYREHGRGYGEYGRGYGGGNPYANPNFNGRNGNGFRPW